jgi:hypothetical protein
MPGRNAIPRNKREVEARERALAVVARMRRESLSLTAAAKAEQTHARTVRRYAATALERAGRRGVFRAKRSDRIARRMNFPTPRGQIEIIVRSSRTASAIGEYLNAVRKYLNTGNTSALARFRNKSFRSADGVKHEFTTDPASLNRLADAGILAIEGLYRVVQGNHL